MSLLVPFDGSELSVAALDRAAEFAEFMDEEVIALAVIPPDPGFARDRGWIEDEERFDVDLVAGRLESRVADIAPAATFRHESPDDVAARASITTDIVRTIRTVAAEVDASILFIGSENAGRVAAPVTSVGNPISEDPQYDVHIVRHPR